MFDHNDMAQIIGYNDGYFLEPITLVRKMPTPRLRMRYLKGWWGGAFARMYANHKRNLRALGL